MRIFMKPLRIFFVAVIVLVGCGLAAFWSLHLLNDYQSSGTLEIKGLKEPVTIQRDEKAMAYIRARNMEDALTAQGFVTAQDRLFQMQLTRLLILGRISELAGPAARNLDVRMRTLGIYRMAEKQAAILDEPTKRFFQSYVQGINAFIDVCPGDIHKEFRLAGIQAEKWSVSDSLAVLYYMGYSTSANLDTEITAQMLLDTLGYDGAARLMPVNINADDPDDIGDVAMPPKDRLSATVGKITSLASLTGEKSLHLGSNNWAVGPDLSASGRAIFCADPHLDARILPGVWYPAGLITPEFRAVGVQIPGIPGMTVGRTDHVALSPTNNYGDMTDLYVEIADPGNPDHYLEGDVSIPFVQIHETLKIKDKDAPGGFRSETVVIRATRRGPIVSDVLDGLPSERPISLRFAPAESMTPEIGLSKALTAKSARELAEAMKQLSMVCLNWVFADAEGNIGFQVSGRIPIRSNKDGTFPFPVKDDQDNWVGWIPPDRMPSAMNPGKKWLGTCNHKTVPHDYPFYYSSFFAPSYRYRRLQEAMARPGLKSLDDLWALQRDTLNLMARSIVPVMAESLSRHDDTRDLARILRDWDFTDDPEKAGPTVFQAVYRSFALQVFEDDLGPDNVLLLLKNWYFWQERLERMILGKDRFWMDDTRTTDRIETLDDLFLRAGLQAKRDLTSLLGNDPRQWRWGKIHTLELVNPILRTGPLKTLLGSGPMAMGGSGETLYRGIYDFSKPFAVTTCASLRMAVDFSDPDKIPAVLPGGVAGRTFHPHQKDQVDDFMSGEKRFWWFSDQAVDGHETARLTLDPAPMTDEIKPED